MRQHQVHRLILPMNGKVAALRELMRSAYPDSFRMNDGFVQNVLHAIVEACRYEAEALPNIGFMIAQFDERLPWFGRDSNELPKQQTLNLIRDIAESTFNEMKANNLYNANGVLQYFLFPVYSLSFNEIALSSIQRLTWNNEHYEPVQTSTCGEVNPWTKDQCSCARHW